MLSTHQGRSLTKHDLSTKGSWMSVPTSWCQRLERVLPNPTCPSSDGLSARVPAHVSLSQLSANMNYVCHMVKDNKREFKKKKRRIKFDQKSTKHDACTHRCLKSESRTRAILLPPRHQSYVSRRTLEDTTDTAQPIAYLQAWPSTGHGIRAFLTSLSPLALQLR